MQKSLRKYAWLFLLPTLIAFVISFLVPFLMGVGLSFTEFTTVTDAKFVGISNYIQALTANSDFLNAFRFTVKFTVISVLSVNILAFALALLLTKGLRGTNFFRTAFFMPNLIGGIVLGYIWQLIINGVLAARGVDLTYNAQYGFWGLVILMNWQMIGYMMVIYVAGLQSIPHELHEVAAIDGANGWQTLKNITIPLVMPSVTICTFLTLSNSFKMFDQNYALTAGAPGKQTQMMALDIYHTFYGSVGQEGVGQAKAVIFFILVALVAFLQMWLTRRREADV
jgi:raffinose/stachyose/melibiose transport system permease protein